MPSPVMKHETLTVTQLMYSTDITYMNQNMKMTRATPTVASAMMTKITIPAIAPAVVL